LCSQAFFPFPLKAISHCHTTAERWQALTDIRNWLSIEDACCTFPHTALDLHADSILCWQLSLAIQYEDVDTSIVCLLCECLALLWSRATHERRLQSMQQRTAIIPVLLHVWQRFRFDHSILRHVLLIFRCWCKVKNSHIKSILVYSDLLQRIREALKEVTHDHPLRPAILHLVKDLTFRAEPKEKGFLYDNVKDLVLEYAKDSSYTIVESMSAALWNWAALERLARSMCEAQDVWTTIQHLLSLPTTHESMPIHRNASSTLGTMLALWTSADSPPELVANQSWIVPHLLHVLETEHDADWRRRCMRTIRCLASCEWGRSFLTKHCESPEQVNRLLIQILKNHHSDETDTRIQTCQTVTALLPHAVQDWTPLWPHLETALIETMQDTKSADKLVLTASQTLCLSLSHSPWKRGSGCFTKTLFERIHAVLKKHTDEPSYHVGFARLVLQLAQDCPEVPDGHSSMLCGPVLETLSLLLSSIGPDYEDSRKDAVATVVLFSNEDQNKKSLAENEKLLTALVNFCLITSGPLKDKAKQVILSLIPEL